MRPVIASSESMAPMRLVMIQIRIPSPISASTATTTNAGRDQRTRSAGVSATGVVGAAMVPVTPAPPRTIAAED